MLRNKHQLCLLSEASLYLIPLIMLSTSLGCISYINACLKHYPSHYCLVPAWNFIGPVVNFMDSCHSANASLASEPKKSTFALFMAVFQLLVVAAWQHMKAAHSLWLSVQSHADSEQPWRGFCLIRGKILLSWSVLVVSFLNCIWSRACFALKRQKKTVWTQWRVAHLTLSLIYLKKWFDQESVLRRAHLVFKSALAVQ